MSAPSNDSGNTSDILDAKLPFSILTDLASPAEWHKRTRQACDQLPALEELLTMIEMREMPDEQGTRIKLEGREISLKHAELFFYLVTLTKPILSVETGFGSGLAAGVITAAHLYNELLGGHVPVQSRAREALDGLGLYTLERLKLTGYQVMEHETAMVLPQMYLQKLNQGLSFVYFNSATEFDEQMMEYYYINQLLNEGGIMAVNTEVAARRELVAYIQKSRHDYAVRRLDDVITLVQTPKLSAIARHNPGLRH